jgi:hypothetical protein
MLLINSSQINKINVKYKDDFIANQILNLRSKNLVLVNDFSEEELQKKIGNLINWLSEFKIDIESHVEYFINIYFKYKISEEDLNTPNIIEIFSYPDAPSISKLEDFHFYVKQK